MTNKTLSGQELKDAWAAARKEIRETVTAAQPHMAKIEFNATLDGRIEVRAESIPADVYAMIVTALPKYAARPESQ